LKLFPKKSTPSKILLGHLYSFGDCLYATVVARQIKEDFPGCHLTWAIGSKWRSVLNGNPHIDEIWEVPFNGQEASSVWVQFEREALKRKKQGDFDEVYFTQFFPSRIYNYDGMIRSSIFRGYPNPITVPVSPVLRLFPNEVDNVRQFADRCHLADIRHVLLFECAPKSGQSFVTPDFALAVSRRLVDSIPDISIVLSSNVPVVSNHPRIVDGSVLSFRENAELTKYCTLLVGCSSGITWISTSDWARPLPMIQLIKRDAVFYAPVAYDFDYWGLSTDMILEMSSSTVDGLVACIDIALKEGIYAAKLRFNENIPFSFKTYVEFLFYYVKHFRFITAFMMIKNNVTVHGLHMQRIMQSLIEMIKRRLAKFSTKLAV
jgi:hypothetical protein